MSKGSAAAPDYQGAAQATAAGNLQNLNAQTWANRPTMVTPWGTSSWDTSVDETAYQRAVSEWKAAGADNKTMPSRNAYTTWSNTVELTPEQQAALNNEQQIQANQSNLAKTLQGQVASTMQDGFNAPSMSSYMSSVPGVKTSFNGYNPTGVNQVKQSFTGGPNQNLNAPQYDASTAAAGTKAAYDASTGLLKDQWEQDTSALDNQLRMQGLTPGTEAYNNAMQNLTRTQGQVQSQLASQAVLTGNEMANRDYASSLAGYTAGNDARSTQFGQDATRFGMSNDAQSQAFTQGLSLYGTDIAARQAANEAQQQSWQQAMDNYRTAYQSSYQDYMTPLNSMNAVLNGQQVQNPSFNGFAQAGYVPGTDYSGAASALGQWNSGQAAQNQGMFSSLLGTAGRLGSAYLMSSDARLKTNIKRIGITEGGHNWYSWDWSDGSGSSRGVMAQEIIVTNPEAVIVGNDGYYRVNYAAIA